MSAAGRRGPSRGDRQIIPKPARGCRLPGARPLAPARRDQLGRPAPAARPGLRLGPGPADAGSRRRRPARPRRRARPAAPRLGRSPLASCAAAYPAIESASRSVSTARRRASSRAAASCTRWRFGAGRHAPIVPVPGVTVARSRGLCGPLGVAEPVRGRAPPIGEPRPASGAVEPASRSARARSALCAEIAVSARRDAVTGAEPPDSHRLAGSRAARTAGGCERR